MEDYSPEERNHFSFFGTFSFHFPASYFNATLWPIKRSTFYETALQYSFPITIAGQLQLSLRQIIRVAPQFRFIYKG